ncbi:uncharacterized protein EDB91DRAFT_1083422, partial [Suillus paluster]|uniref:uncharacterized protein n=1 Tax=Suillus paluster TaxID=48578 RepID=UPI001B874609
IFSTLQCHPSSTTVTAVSVFSRSYLDFGEPSHFSQDYDPDTLEHEQDVYGEYDELDPLDDAEEVIIPHVETHVPAHLGSTIPMCQLPTPEEKIISEDGPRCTCRAAIRHTETFTIPLRRKLNLTWDTGFQRGRVAKEVDVFLHLEHMQTKNNPPSFNTSKDL